MNRCLFLTEIGEGIGFGHVSRCLPIASKLAEIFDVEFWIYEKSTNNFKIDFSNIKVISIDWKKNLKEIQPSDIVIVDSYLASKDFYKSMSSITKKTLIFDDFNRLQYPCKLILNCNASANLNLCYRILISNLELLLFF